MAQKTFFAPKGKNYYPKYPTRGGDSDDDVNI